MPSPSDAPGAGPSVGPEAGASTPTEDEVERVAISAEASEMVRSLVAQHGPVMFHQSGGCCDGSSPMCYPDGEFLIGDSDVKLGDLTIDGVPDVPVYMSKAQFEYWKHTHLTIDLEKGRGAGFSLEGPTGYRFLIRSRLLDAVPEPPEVGVR